mgnify:CR=1 FL=1
MMLFAGTHAKHMDTRHNIPKGSRLCVSNGLNTGLLLIHDKLRQSPS